jgi:hypothetical protein
MQHVFSHHNLEVRMDLHAIICKVPLRVLGPSFAKMEDEMRNHDENTRQREKKRDQTSFLT